MPTIMTASTTGAIGRGRGVVGSVLAWVMLGALGVAAADEGASDELRVRVEVAGLPVWKLWADVLLATPIGGYRPGGAPSVARLKSLYGRGPGSGQRSWSS